MAHKGHFLPEIWNTQSTQHPMRELNRLQRNIDRMFDEFFVPSSTELASFNPPCDIEETESHYIMSFDMPGVKKDDLKIEINDNRLFVSGERKEERKEEKGSRLFVERSYGTFQRSFSLPTSIDSNQVEAHYENGVLMIAIPKSEKEQSKRISIDESQQGGFLKKIQNKKNKSEKAA